MFIEYKDIKEDDITIDTRTYEEFIYMPLFEYNVPIINHHLYQILKSHIYLAVFIVLYGLISNRKCIKTMLINLSNNKQKRIIFGCSQGRLRSPFMYLYAKSLGINAKVLKHGIKPHYHKKRNSIKNLYGFLDI